MKKQQNQYLNTLLSLLIVFGCIQVSISMISRKIVFLISKISRLIQGLYYFYKMTVIRLSLVLLNFYYLIPKNSKNVKHRASQINPQIKSFLYIINQSLNLNHSKQKMKKDSIQLQLKEIDDSSDMHSTDTTSSMMQENEMSNQSTTLGTQDQSKIQEEIDPFSNIHQSMNILNDDSEHFSNDQLTKIFSLIQKDDPVIDTIVLTKDELLNIEKLDKLQEPQQTKKAYRSKQHLTGQRRRKGEKNRLQQQVDGYWTKNFLQFGKTYHFLYLQKQFGSQKLYQSYPELQRIKEKPGMSLDDYLILYNIKDLRIKLALFFKRKNLYRQLMLSRTIPKFKKIYNKFLHVFEKAFQTKIFVGISRKINEPIDKQTLVASFPQSI